jgi:hypothetical protein
MSFLDVRVGGEVRVSWSTLLFMLLAQNYKYIYQMTVRKTMIDDEAKRILSEKPFLTYLTYGGKEYIGIIQNFDEIITTLYDFSAIKEPALKTVFLELGETWWWESNRLIPINVFLKSSWVIFKPCLRTMNSKDVEIVMGPYVSLREMATKRSKRKSITLIRRVT